MLHSESTCQPIVYDNLTLIAIGGSAAVYGIDEATALKDYYDETDEGIAIERNAFRRLGSHRNIVQCLGEPNQKSVILERGQPLSIVMEQRKTTGTELDQKLGWIRDAAQGLQYIHNNGIIHADFGCSNMILVNGRVKIVDFGGCSIDDSEALTCYNWYNCRGPNRPSVETDMFAFGCAVFEILTGKPPYHELEDRREQVRLLYAQNQFPVVEHLPLRELILGCWHGTFSCMVEITRILDTACIIDEYSKGTKSVTAATGQIIRAPT